MVNPIPLVVIPTYNESENLEKIVAAVRETSPDISILIVDDNSPDGTGRIADELAKQDNKIFVLHRPGKAGLGRAYLAGFEWALKQGHFDPICSMDADFSHDPKYLPRLIEAALETGGVAIGSRYLSGGKVVGWTPDRYVLSWSANFAARILLGLKPKDVTAGYKAYPAAFLQSLNFDSIVSPGYAFQVEMITNAERGGWPLTEIPITFQDRTVGRSKVSRHELITSMKSLVNLALKRRGFRQAGKFGLVGAINVVVDLGIMNLLVVVFKMTPTWAGYLGTAVALINSFILNRHWTFRVKSGKIYHQFVQFIVVNGMGAVLNGLVFTLLLQSMGLWYNWAKLIAIGVASAWNFLGTKFLVFRDDTEKAKIN